MENRKINILGTEWKIIICKEEESELLNGKYRDGCTDNSTKTIWICEKKDDCELQDYEVWKRLTLRHEILHAFLFESGLDSSSSSMNGAWAANEEMVDWFAIQSPKIFKAYAELGILDIPIPSIPPLQTGGTIPPRSMIWGDNGIEYIGKNEESAENALKNISDDIQKSIEIAKPAGLLNE